MRKQFVERLRYISIAVIIIAILLLLLNACNLFNDPKKDFTANDYIYEAFNEWYLWYDQIPDIDPNDYDSYKALINAISVDEDRWSYAGSYTEIMDLYQSGEYKGFGAGFMIDYDGKIKITHVYNKSPFGLFGVERGWVVESVNGYTIDDLDNVNKALSSDEPVDFVFTDIDGQTKNLTATKEAFQMNTVLFSDVFDYDAHKIGYLVFNSFLETSVAELTTAFKTFNDQHITDLIVDLRYNGGGLNTTANMLIGMIGGNKVNGQTVANVTHNDKKSYKDESTVIEYSGVTLTLDQVYFITTGGTASASELVINCLDPFMDVSATHGKPVGMYILSVESIDLAILPVCFKTTNSVGYGDYFDGLLVDINGIDDLSHNWGDPEEELFKAAVNDILEPTATIVSQLKSEKAASQQLFDYKGLNQIINAY